MKVQKVEITDEYINMYDVCNTNKGYFIANGLVTHNSSADMSKLALIKIRADELLKERGVRTIIPVHDEILIEAPLRYARFVKKQFAHDMETAARPRLTIPISCDVESSDRWYGEELNLDEVLSEFDD